VLPDGPERVAAIAQASKLLTAYMPYKFIAWRTVSDLLRPAVFGFRHNQFTSYYRYIDIDPGLRSAHAS
jgi:hypothetical protein